MSKIETRSIQEMLEAVESLPSEDQELLVDVIQRRLIEKRRIEIAHHAEETVNSFQNGFVKTGTFNELKNDLMESV